MSKTLISIFTIVILLTTFYAQGVSSKELHQTITPETTNKQYTSLEPPPWPFDPLKRREIKARLKFFLDTQNYEPKENSQKTPKTTCEKTLNDLKDHDNLKILIPDIIAQSRLDKSIPSNLIHHCPKVEMDRIWFSWEKGPLSEGVDPDFDTLPLEQKDQAADFYTVYSGPIEFYDISEYFNGEETWGTFAEGGRIICNNDRRVCSELNGYRLYNGDIVGAVINAKTCQKHVPTKVKASNRLLSNTSKPYSYRELPTFYAFADINGSLHRIGLSTSTPWSNFYHLLHGKTTTLITESVNKKPDERCVFESKQ
ncbi:MAG: hypothetical protein KME37_09705 [Candidatus Thiodiazotropha sp. (ex Codakia orbicularis)]|nr:hypothetical protein [Candidatus Thiodiazotropha sp. (ex Codakia orbicularis)]